MEAHRRGAGVAHFPPPSMLRTLPGVGASLLGVESQGELPVRD